MRKGKYLLCRRSSPLRGIEKRGGREQMETDWLALRCSSWPPYDQYLAGIPFLQSFSSIANLMRQEPISGQVSMNCLTTMFASHRIDERWLMQPYAPFESKRRPSVRSIESLRQDDILGGLTNMQTRTRTRNYW